MTLRLALRRAALGALIVATSLVAMMSAWPSCDSEDPATSGGEPLGPTFGAEIALTVVGRGRVTSTPSGIDCPSTCFTRLVLADPSVDGGDGGISLVPTETVGAHFVGWTLAAVELGVRASGPSQCSPMTRKSTTLPVDSSYALTVPFGETTGTPPRGREEECAAFTKVPVAYALTATFEEDFIPPGPDASPPDAGSQPLFRGNGAAKEVGVAGGYVYWRYELNGLSGIASGFAGSSQFDVLLAPFNEITLFDVDAHVVFQHASGVLQAFQAGNGFAVTLGNAPTCAAVASDFANVYCRANGASTSTLYSWPITGAPSPTVVHVLPLGRDLAVDDQQFYFSDDKGGFTNQAIVESAPRTGDGGMPPVTQLFVDQTSPHDLAVGSSYLFWLDDRGSGISSARSGDKLTPFGAKQSVTGSSVRFIAAERFASSYWVGIAAPGFGGGTIQRAFGGSTSTSPFRTGITGLSGLAVDFGYVYWTQTDGSVYRAPRNDAQL